MNANKRLAMNAWNVGLTLEEANKRYNFDFTEYFTDFEEKYGCGSIPVYDLLEYKPKKDTDPKLLEWRGDIGPGAELRELIKQHNASVKS